MPKYTLTMVSKDRRTGLDYETTSPAMELDGIAEAMLQFGTGIQSLDRRGVIRKVIVKLEGEKDAKV